ncbi:MAG: type II toxin-antitoxin system HicB family antitoxin [bacterium]|nr:type II toxin-antitoxin system HicB family antitoxin [bacterium]
MKKLNLKNAVWKEDKYYVALNFNTQVSSFGETRKEALDSLEEALELYFEDEPVPEMTKVERLGIVPFTLQYA